MVDIAVIIIIVTCLSGYRRGFGLGTGCIDHFNARFVTTINYSTVSNFHTLQIARAHAKSFPVCSVFTSSCLVTAPTVAIPGSYYVCAISSSVSGEANPSTMP
jgi:hypothetical protein